MHLINLLHFCIRLFLFINHLCFLNLKIPNTFLDFNLLIVLPMDSTLTRHYIKF